MVRTYPMDQVVDGSFSAIKVVVQGRSSFYFFCGGYKIWIDRVAIYLVREIKMAKKIIENMFDAEN